MLSISLNDGPEDSGRISSKDFRGLDRTAGGGRSGLEGRTGECDGEPLWPFSETIGRERVRVIGGAERE